CAVPAQRDPGRRRGRSGGGAALHRPDEARVAPAHRARPGDHRPLPPPGARRAGRLRARGPRRRRRRGRRPGPGRGRVPPDHRRRRRRGGPARLRGRRPAHHGRAQPPRQRPATLAAARPGLRRDRARRRPGPPRRRRPGRGHPPGAAGADLRALLPGRPGPCAPHRRHGARAEHRQARRRRPRRRGRGLVQARGRLDLHPRPAPRRGAHRPRCTTHPHDRSRCTAMTTILLVEDEESYREPLTYQLERDGYDVVAVDNGSDALTAYARTTPDLVLLDLMLPGMSGTEVCRELRRQGNTPVIMLTAKDEEFDKVLGLELGADDYVTKPYSYRELVARMRAVLRRGSDPGEGDTGGVLEVGHVRMDVGRHELFVHGEPTRMPLREFELLEVLMRNVDHVLTRGQLIDRVWGADYVGDTKTLDVHVKRIRAKIEAEPSSPEMLLTVRGLGYKLVAPTGNP